LNRHLKYLEVNAMLNL